MSSPAKVIQYVEEPQQEQGQTFGHGNDADLEQPLLVATNVTAVPVNANSCGGDPLQPTPSSAVGGGALGVSSGAPYVQSTTSRRVVSSFGQRRDRRGCCSWFGNVLWLVFGGWHLFLTWITVGISLCATIVGIPFGWQCIKVAFFLLFPFGKQAVYYEDVNIHSSSGGGGCCCCCCCCKCNSMSSFCTALLNCIWAICIGWILALQALLTGILLCLTICGIPFGIQCFKLMHICFFPFGMDFTAIEERLVVVEQRTTTQNSMVERTTTTFTTDYEAI